ncbi:hypothetical protein VI817_003532 [Penicillium citrinum]|nr:hypothetical protein VI817_003532 [Penicillium citrinum]
MEFSSRPTSETVRSKLEDKIVIVTGAAQGIGFATAALLARHGARVVLVDLNEADLKNACAEIGHDCSYQVCDVSDWEQQTSLFHTVTKSIGPLYLLICNAAINPEISLLRGSDPEQYSKMNSQVRYNYLADEKEQTEASPLCAPPTNILDVNINSVIFGLKLGVHHMKQHGEGRIVVTASAGSYVPIPTQPLYAATKHAVLGLCRSTAHMKEVTNSGVAISWIAPWLTITPMVEDLQATASPDTMKSSPEDVGWGIVTAALAEDPNGKGYWIQGQTIREVEGAYGEVAGNLIHPDNQF